MKNGIISQFKTGFLAVLLLLGSCQGFFDKEPLDEPATQNFYSTANELDLAIYAAYNGLVFLWRTNGGGYPSAFIFDLTTDIGWNRGGVQGINDLANGQANARNTTAQLVWKNHYQAIARANNILDKMEKARENTTPAFFNQIEGEARFIRAYLYHQLIELYGDVPLVTTQIGFDEAQIARTPKSEIATFLLTELEEIAAKLPVNYPSSLTGRATQGAALSLKARIALYNEQWDTAIDAAQRVINLGTYSLHNDYETLFTKASQNNTETIFDYRYQTGAQTHGLHQFQGTRMMGSWSVPIPLQALVDSYECTDGLTIDQSPLYDPANPFENRDPRLDQTVLRSGAAYDDVIFDTHPDHTTTIRVSTGETVTNTDVTNRFASFSGYVWRKYLDPAYLERLREVDLNIILMRYAEVLLTYAEAKVEKGDIDASVLDAINQVRQRPTVDMPAITSTNQSTLRTIVRRERKVELAYEGLRLFDIRRWGIADDVLTTPALGRPNGDYSLQGVPVFDEFGHPHYDAYQAVLKQVEERNFNAGKNYLWPIPASELLLNTALIQNSGY